MKMLQIVIGIPQEIVYAKGTYYINKGNVLYKQRNVLYKQRKCQEHDIQMSYLT